MNDKLAELRVEYETAGLDRSMMSAEPIQQFDVWMSEAIDAGISQPNAMILATADLHGRPSSRAVLLKDFDDRGFSFYTNLKSQKGVELRSNPVASLCFLWMDLHRQLRIDGSVELVGDKESDAYFSSRPVEAQLAAAASPQSQPIANRETLKELVADLADSVGDNAVERPSHWGGIRVRPRRVEFWQGRAHRLHDRLVYARHDGRWTLERLAP